MDARLTTTFRPASELESKLLKPTLSHSSTILAMVYFRSPHPSPETATPLLSEIIAEAARDAETCHLNGRFFCASGAAPTPAAADRELLNIARDYQFLYDADAEIIYAELRRRLHGATT